MAQILYSLVSVSDTLLIHADVHDLKGGKYIKASNKILKKIATNKLRRPDGMATLLSGSYAYNYMHGCDPEDEKAIPHVEHLIFMCVTESMPYSSTPSEVREAAFGFLARIRKSFLQQFESDIEYLCKRPDRADNSSTDSSYISIDPSMKHHLKRFSNYMKDQMVAVEKDPLILDSQRSAMDVESQDMSVEDLSRPAPASGHPVYHPGAGSKLTKVIHTLEQAKEKVRSNIDLISHRGENLSLLEGQAAKISESSTIFRQSARRTQYHYCKDLYQQRFILALFAVLVLYLMSAMLCGWKWDAC